MSSGLEADVAIVGAGPAGSATAALIAREGFDVLLVDRQAFPRPKPCGDCLSPEATRVLARLGVLDRVEDAAPARLDGWRVIGPDGAMFETRFADICGGDPRVASSLAIERVCLDTMLLEHAIRAGARFLAPLQITRLGDRENGRRRLEARIPTPARNGPRDLDALADSMGRASDRRDASRVAGRITIRAPLIIGADGLRSVIARDIGARRRAPRRRKLSFTAHVAGARGVTSIGELHVAHGACVGIAPVTSVSSPPDHTGDRVRALHRALEPPTPAAAGAPRCNVTLVVESDRFRHAAAANPAAFFASMLERFPAVRGRLREAHLIEHVVSSSTRTLLASGSFDRPVNRIAADGVALAGDAAGYFDPFTGQGIYHALAGAEILAAAACRALAAGGGRSNIELRDYAHEYTRLIRPVHRVQRLIDEVLRRPALADAAIARLARRPGAARALIAVTSDLRRPASLLSPSALRSLAMPI